MNPTQSSQLNPLSMALIGDWIQRQGLKQSMTQNDSTQTTTPLPYSTNQWQPELQNVSGLWGGYNG